MWDAVFATDTLVRAGVILGAWIAFAFIARRLEDNPREEAQAGVIVAIMKVYVWVMHGLRVHGRENIPPRRAHGPLIVVANHTAGVDPVLIQTVTPFETRFMMARDMQPEVLKGLWEWTGVIAVNRDGPDAKAARDAIRYLTHGGLDGRGGVIGIFPEGGIERPARQILPFLPGIGLMVAKSGARVLPVIINGTPITPTAWGSLFTRSRSTLTFLPIIDYKQSKLKPGQIAEDLRKRFLDATRWPANDTPKRELTQR